MSSNNLDGRESHYSTRVNDSRIFYKFKVILLGDSGVGKTSLLSRYMDEEFSDKQCTINADFKIKSIQIDPFTSAQITIWDTCGQEKYRSMTRQYFKDAHGIILMFDISDKRSFSNLEGWLEDIKENSIKDDVSIVIVGNKTDLKFRNIKHETAVEFCKTNGITYCETSSKEGLNIESPFETVTKEIIEKKKIIKKYNNNDDTEKILVNKKKDIKEQKREKELKCC